MGRIVFISHRHDDLVPTIIKRFQKRLRSLVLNLKFNVGMCCVGFLLLMSM